MTLYKNYREVYSIRQAHPHRALRISTLLYHHRLSLESMDRRNTLCLGGRMVLVKSRDIYRSSHGPYRRCEVSSDGSFSEIPDPKCHRDEYIFRYRRSHGHILCSRIPDSWYRHVHTPCFYLLFRYSEDTSIIICITFDVSFPIGFPPF